MKKILICLFVATFLVCTTVLVGFSQPTENCEEKNEIIHKSCKNVKYAQLPKDVKRLMASIRCDVKTGSVYDCGFALDLNGDGNVEYAFCCEESPHGPCSMKIFGKVSGKWKVLLPDTNMAGYCGGTDPCNGFHVLDGTNEKYHEICQEGKILEFKNGRYKWER